MRLAVSGLPGLPVNLVPGPPDGDNLVMDFFLMPGEFPENPRDACVLIPLAYNLVGVVAHEHVQVPVPVDVKLSTDKAGVVAGAVVLQVLERCFDGCHQYHHPSVSNSRSVAPVG